MELDLKGIRAILAYKVYIKFINVLSFVVSIRFKELYQREVEQNLKFFKSLNDEDKKLLIADIFASDLLDETDIKRLLGITRDKNNVRITDKNIDNVYCWEAFIISVDVLINLSELEHDFFLSIFKNSKISK